MRRLLLVGVLVVAGSAGVSSAGADGPAAGDWYVAHDHAADAQSELPASLTPVRVAVLDSGIDGGHPALAGSLVGARSFIGGNPLVDTDGHGTFIAGEIVAVPALPHRGTHTSSEQERAYI